MKTQQATAGMTFTNGEVYAKIVYLPDEAANWAEIPDSEVPQEEIDKMEAMQVEDDTVQVPEKISNLQLRSQLILQGFDLNLIEQTFNRISDATQRELIITAWEYATNFYRNNPMIVAMGNLLGLTPSQVDEIFINASKL